MKEWVQHCVRPLGAVVLEGRRKEGSAVFVVFWPFPVSNIKPPHTLTVRQTLWVRAGGQTDLCVFVCVTPPPPLMDQMAGQESRECLQSCMLKRSTEQGIICLRLSLSSVTLTLFCIIDTVAWPLFFFFWRGLQDMHKTQHTFPPPLSFWGTQFALDTNVVCLKFFFTLSAKCYLRAFVDCKPSL